MSRILFFTFFGYRDYILHIKESFERNNCVIFDLPYIVLKNDEKKSDMEVLDCIAESVVTNKIDVIFMFLLPNVIKFIKNMKIKINDEKIKTNDTIPIPKIVFFNFDDPKSINIDMERYGKDIDYLFTPIESSAMRLKSIMNKDMKIIHMPRFFDTNIPPNCDNIDKSTIEEIKTRQKPYDICILYDKSAEDIYDMKRIVKEIKMFAIDKELTLKILGDQTLENEYPDVYEGTYGNNDVVKKTKDSKIIIYINDSMLDDRKYSITLYLLFASGMIVMTSFSRVFSHLAKDGYNCMIYENNTYIQKLVSCLNNYNYYSLMRSNAIKSINEFLNIDTWSKNILTAVSSK